MEQQFGIKGSVLRWLKSYLSDGYDFVHVNESSKYDKVSHGDPQGSVLGPDYSLYACSIHAWQSKAGASAVRFPVAEAVYRNMERYLSDGEGT